MRTVDVDAGDEGGWSGSISVSEAVSERVGVVGVLGRAEGGAVWRVA